MKMRSLKVPATKTMAVMLLACASLSPLSARAEIKQGSIEVSPFAGYNMFEKNQNLKDTLIYGGRLGYNFTPNWGIEGTAEFVNTRVDDKTRTGVKKGQFRSPTDRVDLGAYHLDLLYHFLPDGKFNPYVVAGIGGMHYSPRISTQDMTAINFGAGAKFWVADNVALRVDVRDNVASEVFKNAYHNVNATAGIVFAFGGTSKASPVNAVATSCPDPVVAKATPCPDPVVAKDTTPPYATLTTPYNASTDTPVHRKIRVAFSEPMDSDTINSQTFILYQGTTVVPGTVATPTSTSASFTQTSNLAPGTLYTAKITTGAKDLAGNPMTNDYVWSFKTASVPDPKTETKVITINRLVMLEDTHFAYNKADLSPEGKEILNQNAKIMKDNPDIKIRIAGYTSAAGSVAYNQSLSERRADNVMTYMINEGGIAPERLETIGYGETRPAIYEVKPSDHESKAAKANMRVLFEVIVK